MNSSSNSVFISYRREASDYLSIAVCQSLRSHGIDAFYDTDSINAGQWMNMIMNQIAARPYFVVILTPGTLKRCKEPNDVLLREIEEAILLERVLVPLWTPKFKWSDVDTYLSSQTATKLKNYNGMELPHRWFGDAMQKLCQHFILPITIPTASIPSSDIESVEQNQARIAATPIITVSLLTAQEYFERGLTHSDDNIENRIADFSEAIRLNPLFIDAYIHRSKARMVVGDLDGYKADAAKALRLAEKRRTELDEKLNFLLGIKNLIVQAAKRHKDGDLDGSIADWNEVIRLDPLTAIPYNDLALVYLSKGDLDKALEYFNQAIHLDPTRAIFYHNRSIVYDRNRDYVKVIADKQKFLDLEPQHPFAKRTRDDIVRLSKLI